MKLRSIEAEWQRTKYSKEAGTIGERFFLGLPELSAQISRPAGKSNSESTSRIGSSGSETNLALVMMGYVLVYLVCHTPRLLLNIYEVATVR